MDVLSRGVRKWHSDQVSENTSPSANVAFYRSQATGQYWPALAHAFEAVRDVERLADMGFCTRCPLGMKGKLAADHPLVLDENTWAALAMRFCFALLLHRWASLLWHVQALPGRFAALVDPSADIREAALAFIKECWQVWLEADKRTEKQVRSWCKRSWFQCVVVREVCEELAKRLVWSMRQQTWQRIFWRRSALHPLPSASTASSLSARQRTGMPTTRPCPPLASGSHPCTHR